MNRARPTALGIACGLACGLAGLLASLPLAQAAQAPSVGSIARHSELGSSWLLGPFVVDTPRMIRIQPSAPLPQDIDQAIQHYERVAQLDASPATRAEALRRIADLRLRQIDAGNADAALLPQVIAGYRRVLAEVPQYSRNDRVHYQLARALQLAGDEDAAIAELQTLAQQYPQSPRMADASFRVAELLYVKRDYAEAEQSYARVVAQGEDTPYFAVARFKLGWSQYQQGDTRGALRSFLAVLDDSLPAREFAGVDEALASVQGASAAYASDALRVVSLSFAAQGGGAAINAHFAQTPPPAYVRVLYQALAEQLLQLQRYTEAAQTYTAYLDRHPDDDQAPALQRAAIAALEAGGFDTQVLAAREAYVNRYAPDQPYWQDKVRQAGVRQAGVPDAVLTAVRQDLDTLARHAQAAAQQMNPSAEASRQRAFRDAARWHERRLALFPDDPDRAKVRMLAADALLDAGDYAAASAHYATLAYDATAAGANPAQAADAGYAQVQVQERWADTQSADAAQAAELQRQAVASMLRYADAFPGDPRAPLTLARAAVIQHALGDHAQTLVLAERALKAPLPPAQRLAVLGVRAESQFALADYAAAEAGFAAYLSAAPLTQTEYSEASERLATSIYKQAEAARAAGDLPLAAATFLRVGQRVPNASIRATADYDAAAAYLQGEDWRRATQVLEAFRQRFAQHPLAGEVDKKLAVAYSKDAQPLAAAQAYARIAARGSVAADERRAAAWLSAELFERSGAAQQAAVAYANYLNAWPQPLPAAQTARQHLADLALLRNDGAARLRWLDELVRAAGVPKDPAARQQVAQAQLEIGRAAAVAARRIALRAPIEQSLPQRKAAIDRAVASLRQAADAGFAEVTTAATYELASVYRDLGQALLKSERPRGLDALAAEQYELLLEEQAFPFEEQAIRIHTANVERLRQGVWNDSVQRSAAALAEMAPAQYGKHEHRERVYESPL